MRMWMVQPQYMCRNHLLGEHRELHALLGSARSGVSLSGYIANNLLEPRRVKSRHGALAREMKRRGWNHQTPLEIPRDVWRRSLPAAERNAVIHREEALGDLLERCSKCYELYVAGGWSPTK